MLIHKGSSGDFEINEVIQSYERRLQEQVTLAKLDIISALECQIQVLIYLRIFSGNVSFWYAVML